MTSTASGRPNGIGAAGADTARIGAGVASGADRDAAGMAGSTQQASVAELYEAHFADLARLAIQFVDDPAIAQDVVQDVFLALHQRGDAALPDNPQRYLTTAVVNRSRSVLRRRKVARAYRPDRPAAAEAADAESLRAADRARILAALAGLPRRQREVLILRYYRDLEIAEIAAMLGISPGAVSTSISRGIKTLTTRISPSQSHYPKRGNQ